MWYVVTRVTCADDFTRICRTLQIPREKITGLSNYRDGAYPIAPYSYYYLVEASGVRTGKRIIVAVGVPVVARLHRVGGNEASDAGVIIPVTKQHQAAVAVGLVLPFAHETERRRRRACSADGHSEAVVEQRVRDCLTAAGDAPRAAERIAVVELARCAPSLAEAGSVDRRAVLAAVFGSR